MPPLSDRPDDLAQQDALGGVCTTGQRRHKGVNYVDQVGEGVKGVVHDARRRDLGLSLFIPYRYTEDRMFRAMQDAGFADWTLAQCRVFQRIAPDGSRLTDLADQAQMSKQSAGILAYSKEARRLRVFLVHPGGPFWSKKDLGSWSIPKGEFVNGEDTLTAAKRG